MTSQFKNTEIIDTGFLRLPRGTTNERPVSPEAGQIRFNTDLGKPEWYEPEYGVWLTTDRQPPVVASGGDTVQDVDIDGVTYRVHSFTTIGESNFTVTRGGEVEYLIVAGGGAGGTGNHSGGGGAGGVLQGRTQISSEAYTVTVGNGGQRQNDVIVNGDNSTALGLTAVGGGGGSGGQNVVGGSGGSGGGGQGRLPSNAAGNGTPGQGNPGGTGGPSDTTGGSGGGGGGAGQPGFAFIGEHIGGPGGAGISSSISGLNKFYGGGGGGQSWAGDQPGAGGIGGGGKGAEDTNEIPADPGQTNTGGGGGGGRTNTSTQRSASGGSGIVVIRYPIS